MIELIIPTFKPKDYLYECLHSIDEQNIDFSLFKVTIVLNGPKEPYYNKIKHWLGSCRFNSELLYSEISGVSYARNMALNKCVSTYVTFLDDDDVLSFNYLSSLICKAQLDSIVVSNTYNFVNSLENEDINNDYLTFEESFSSSNLIEYRKYLSNACCKLIPLSLIGETRFNENLKRSEDAVFMFALSNRIDRIISTDPNAIYYRRLRENSASRSKYKLSYEIKDALVIMLSFSKVYFLNVIQYSFMLYITRILAVVKRVFLNFRSD